MFSAASTPPRAKADLKKQMLAQKTRKAFTDIILPRVLGDPATHVKGAGNEGTEDAGPVDDDVIPVEIIYVSLSRTRP